MSKQELTMEGRLRKGLKNINIRQSKQKGDHSSTGDAGNVCMNSANKIDEKDSPMTSQQQGDIDSSPSTPGTCMNGANKNDETDSTDNPQQQDFKKILQDIQHSAEKEFQPLLQECRAISLPPLDSPEDADFYWTELEIDWTSQNLLPADEKKVYRALKTVGDGNCLFRAASILAFGNDQRHEEMRVRTVFELALNSQFYLKQEGVATMLKAEAQERERHQSNVGSPNVASEFSPEDVKAVFEGEVRDTTGDAFWACYWHLQALGAVLNRQVRSVYPECGGENIRKYLNTLISPRCGDGNKQPVAILWSRTHGDDSLPFLPNHFVPLVPFNKIPPSWAKALPPELKGVPSENDYKSMTNQKGPYHQDTGKIEKVRSVHGGAYVKDVIYDDCFALDKVSLKLDYPVSGVPGSCYWPHFAQTLGVSEKTRLLCQNNSNYRPSARMFAYLSATSPGLTISKLKESLRKIERIDLVSKLEKSSLLDTDCLKHLLDRELPMFHDICIRLDCSFVHNWQDLGAELSISADILGKCESPENYTEEALQIIYTRRPSLTVKKMKDTLKDMGQESARIELSKLSDESTIKTLLEDTTVLQKFTTELDRETPNGSWKVFAQKFGVSKEVCDYMCPDKCYSPTKILLQHLSQAKPELTLESFIEALLQIERKDVVDETLKKLFNPKDIDCIVDAINIRGLGTGLQTLRCTIEESPGMLC